MRRLKCNSEEVVQRNYEKNKHILRDYGFVKFCFCLIVILSIQIHIQPHWFISLQVYGWTAIWDVESSTPFSQNWFRSGWVTKNIYFVFFFYIYICPVLNSQLRKTCNMLCYMSTAVVFWKNDMKDMYFFLFLELRLCGGLICNISICLCFVF